MALAAEHEGPHLLPPPFLRRKDRGASHLDWESWAYCTKPEGQVQSVCYKMLNAQVVFCLFYRKRTGAFCLGTRGRRPAPPAPSPRARQHYNKASSIHASPHIPCSPSPSFGNQRGSHEIFSTNRLNSPIQSVRMVQIPVSTATKRSLGILPQGGSLSRGILTV